MRQIIFATCVFTLVFTSLFGQERKEKISLDGELVTALITDDNDTILIAELEDVTVSAPRFFKDKEEYRRYLKYRRYAAIVYPYAVDAIKNFRHIEEETKDMKKGKRKKYVRKLKKELKQDYLKPLKDLTKTQGKILIKMIEKEMGDNMYNMIKKYRGGMTATTWNIAGNLNGFKLKEGYVHGKDPVLDAVLSDFDVSYRYY